MTGKFTKFGLTIHPKGGENVNWKKLTKNEITKKLEELKFIKPLGLSRVLINTKIFKERKINKSTNEVQEYFSTIENFGGQLELGDKNGVPHYQCWLELTVKNTQTKLLKYFSQVLYGEDRSPCISVKVLTNEMEDYICYCMKERRANLPGSYSHINIDKMIGKLDSYLKEVPEAKKSLKLLMDTKGT